MVRTTGRRNIAIPPAPPLFSPNLRRNSIMTRLRGIRHVLVPMGQTAFAIRHEKADSRGHIAYVTGWGPHLLGDVHTRHTSMHRVLRRGVKIHGVWARITNGDASFVQWDRILKCSQMSRIRLCHWIVTVRMPRKVRRENLLQYEFHSNCLTDRESDTYSVLTTWLRPLLKLDSKGIPSDRINVSMKIVQSRLRSFLLPSISDISWSERR